MIGQYKINASINMKFRKEIYLSQWDGKEKRKKSRMKRTNFVLHEKEKNTRE